MAPAWSAPVGQEAEYSGPFISHCFYRRFGLIQSVFSVFFLDYRLNTWFYWVTVQSLSFFVTYQLTHKPINSLTHSCTHLCCRDWNDVTLAKEAAIANLDP